MLGCRKALWRFLYKTLEAGPVSLPALFRSPIPLLVPGSVPSGYPSASLVIPLFSALLHHPLLCRLLHTSSLITNALSTLSSI